MRYVDGPTTEAQAVINAPADVISALITDISRRLGGRKKHMQANVDGAKQFAEDAKT